MWIRSVGNEHVTADDETWKILDDYVNANEKENVGRRKKSR